MKKYVNGEYVEMTEGEIKHIEEILKDEPVTEPTIEEQILALQNALITSKISGGGITTITDSSDNQIKNLKVFGKSEQVQTTGAQLFNAREVLKTQIEKGVVTFNREGKIVLNGKFDANNRQFNITLQPGTYTLSGDDNGVWHILAPFDGVFRQKLVVEVETTYACYIASGTYNNHVTAPMINIGETAKPYEPYTGGKPSPSPEYPQEITIAGENGTIDLEITGENVEPQSLTLSTPNGLPGIKVDTGGNYTDSTGQQWITDEIDLARGKYVQRVKRKILNATPNGLPGIKVDTGGNYTDSTGQQWITDEIDLARGKYVQRVKRKILNDTEKWKHSVTEKYKNNNFQTIINEERSTLNNRSMCNYIRYATLGWDDISVNLPKIYAYDTQITASFPPESEINSLETWRNYLKEKGDFEIQYVLATPIETDLPPETIEAFKTLHTNYPTTVISNDENAGMEVSYVADTKHYIDKKFEELNQAIVNTQIALL